MDIALVKNEDKPFFNNIALVFLPADAIPAVVGEGKVDLGITGRDQIAEHEARQPSTKEHGVEEVLDLGFGKCKLQVQVPEKGGSSDPRDLIGKNVVTSFTSLTAQYFRKLEKQQSTQTNQDPQTNGTTSSPGKIKTNITEWSGSVEAACALGVGDGIVDLVGSSTL